MPSSSRKPIIFWCLYDAGSTAFSTVIITFIFSIYFSRQIVGDTVRGGALWGYMLAAAGVVIAITAPVLGAFADQFGARRTMLRGFSFLCIIATACLYFAAPGNASIPIALVLTGIAAIGLELSLVLSYALLPVIATPAQLGRVSGWSWASGYAGGLCCLALALILLFGLGAHHPSLLLPTDAAQNVRAAAPLTALWFAIFAAPLLFSSIATGRTGLSARAAFTGARRHLLASISAARGQRNLLKFLIASALYRDGMNTLFAIGGLYAANTIGLSFEQILIFAVGLNVFAGLGAFLFSFADDRFGSKRVILTGLTGLLVTGAVILILHDRVAFIAVALILGIFVGPVQATSRTLAARLSPPDAANGTFGLYALTGKATAFLGPLLFGLVTDLAHSQRAGMATILLFWLAGGFLLLGVKETRAS